MKGGRFYRAGADNATADVCLAFDLEKGKIHASSTDAYKLGMAGIEANVANQDEEPHVYIRKDKSGAISFSTKGKVSKTLVACETKDTVNDMILNSKILRQVVPCYDKEEKMTIIIGEKNEPVSSFGSPVFRQDEKLHMKQIVTVGSNTGEK